MVCITVLFIRFTGKQVSYSKEGHRQDPSPGVDGVQAEGGEHAFAPSLPTERRPLAALVIRWRWLALVTDGFHGRQQPWR